MPLQYLVIPSKFKTHALSSHIFLARCGKVGNVGRVIHLTQTCTSHQPWEHLVYETGTWKEVAMTTTDSQLESIDFDRQRFSFSCARNGVRGIYSSAGHFFCNHPPSEHSRQEYPSAPFSTYTMKNKNHIHILCHLSSNHQRRQFIQLSSSTF